MSENMDTKDINKKNGAKKKSALTRRDFLKASAVVTAGAGLAMTTDMSLDGPNKAMAAAGDIKLTYTTCPFCSVGCSMEVSTLEKADGTFEVVDVTGDPFGPVNRGANCSKGAASIQIVNSTRRVGVPGSIHQASDPLRGNPGPMKRTGNGAWEPIAWDAALGEIAGRMVSARGTVPVTAGKVTASTKGVAFLGCSHATNEENWLYRKLIANFGTNNTEHQARI
jgi:formate dehydrogenase major subunit